jgi:hypothetical protein
MNPKKVSTIIKKTADDLDFPESLVDDVISFYWEKVRKTVNDIESHSLKINSLGTFKIKSWKLKDIIKKYEAYTKDLDENDRKYMTFQKHAILDATKDRLKNLYKVHKEIEEEKKREEEIKEKRKKYVNNQNLEGKESNI